MLSLLADLKQLECRLDIEVPDLVVAQPLLATPQQVLDGESFVDADYDPGDVEHDEQEHSDEEDDGEVDVRLDLVLLLLTL